MLVFVLWLLIGISFGQDVPEETPPDPFTKCEYNGQFHSLGEHWTDGPCLHCYCMSTGMNASVCRESCSTFAHIPDHCHLKTPPGKCCPEVQCDFFNKCVSKGRYYSQNETWTEGCDYTCTCANAAGGFIQCAARCPTYHLPTGCYLQPVLPGSAECCPTVKCESGPVG